MLNVLQENDPFVVVETQVKYEFIRIRTDNGWLVHSRCINPVTDIAGSAMVFVPDSMSGFEKGKTLLIKGEENEN